eukprot:scaffold5058_cov138-Skeletonema_marinoi.AAC.2
MEDRLARMLVRGGPLGRCDGRLFWIRIVWCSPLHTTTCNFVPPTRGSYVPSSYSSPHSKEKEDSSLRRLDLLGAVLLDCNNIVVLNNMNISYSFLAIAKQLEENQLRVDMIE